MNCRELTRLLLALNWLACLIAPRVGASGLEVQHLTGSSSSNGIIIAWPLPVTNWVLEQSPQLSASSSWARVPSSLYQTSATNTFIKVSPLEGNRFYRLRNLIPAIPGLTGHWTFDQEPGQVAQDSSGYENTAFLIKAAWSPGRIGPGALWFNGGPVGLGGSQAWVSNANYRVLPPQDQPFSVSLWFNPDALTPGWSGLLGNDANGSNGWHLALYTPGPGTNELIFAATGPGTFLSVTGRTLLLPEQWHELTATCDGNEGIIFLDGAWLARGSGTLLANNDPIFFGGGVGGFDSFLGRLDEVRVYTNALTQADISLNGHWRFEEDAGTFAADSSLRGHHATVSDPPAWVSGKDGYGISLSNSTVRISNGDSEVLPPTGGAFSISLWLYPNLPPSGWSGLMSCADETNTGWYLALYAEASKQTRLHFWSTNTGGTLDVNAPIALATGMWSKLDLTYNGGIATVYVNGLKVQSDSGGIQGSTAPLMVGTVPGMTNINGVIDDLKIYNRERSESEIGPVAKVMWETIFINTATNIVLQGFGPAGKPLTYTLVDYLAPTNGTVTNAPGSPLVTYTAGAQKGPDVFAYRVSDGEFTSPPTIVVVSVVQPHWLSPGGGSTPPLDGSSPDKAWVAGSANALDAIWHTNDYYDCFFYAPGEYETTGCEWQHRRTANPGCKHIGSGADGSTPTTLKLVNAWEARNEELIFGGWAVGAYCDGFEVQDMVLDCNAVNSPKYTIGEPVWITIPLLTTGRVDSVTLHWDNSQFIGTWNFGPAQTFSILTKVIGSDNYVTNVSAITSTGRVEIVPIGADTDEIVIRLERRARGVDFYGLSEIEVNGASVSIPTATTPGGGESRLDPSLGNYSIQQAADRNNTTVWASGPEDQVRIELPLQPGSAVSQVNLYWNCQTLDGVGRLGPAAGYQFQARDPNTQQYYDVPFIRQERTDAGMQVNTLGTAQSPMAILTDRLIILLTAKELGVDFYSLHDIGLQNASEQVLLKLPSALNSLSWGDYNILRAFDHNPATQWASDTQGMIGAMDVVGSNLKFTHLRIVGFGTKATRECFPMFLHTPPAWAPRLSMGNVLVQDCVFTEPATNNTDGLTAAVLEGFPPQVLTNAFIRRCTVAGVKSQFRYSNAFSAINVENCLVSDCGFGVYFEPNPSAVDVVGPVLIRSNQFLNVQSGVVMSFAAAAQFDSLTCLGNETVLTGAGGWGFAASDTISPGPSGSITNLTVLNNIVRYANWSVHPANYDGGLHCSDIHNAVFGNNVIALGTASSLRLRGCPSGYIPGQIKEQCDGLPPVVSVPSFPPCLDLLPPGYRRSWFNNRDLVGTLLEVRYWQTNSDGFASQQQWR